MEGEVITMQDLFVYKYVGEDEEGNLKGTFEPSGMRPACYERAEYFGLGRTLMETVS